MILSRYDVATHSHPKISSSTTPVWEQPLNVLWKNLRVNSFCGSFSLISLVRCVGGEGVRAKSWLGSRNESYLVLKLRSPIRSPHSFPRKSLQKVKSRPLQPRVGMTAPYFGSAIVIAINETRDLYWRLILLFVRWWSMLVHSTSHDDVIQRWWWWYRQKKPIRLNVLSMLQAR